MEYISYETTTAVTQPGEAHGYWMCKSCGHVIYNFLEGPLIPSYIETRSNHLLKELEDEIERVRKWMRDKDAPPEIMKLFERTRQREVWML